MRLFLLLFFVVSCNSSAQLLLKAAALNADSMSGLYCLAAAIICLGCSLLCWFTALRLKPLSFLHPFAALTYILVPGLAALLFEETVSVRYVMGIVCIVAGICITSTSVRTPNAGIGKTRC